MWGSAGAVWAPADEQPPGALGERPGEARLSAAWPLFAGRVVRVRPRRVVGRVEHFLDLGNLLPDQALDARLERDVGGAATLTPSAHLQIHLVVLDVDQLDEAP